MCICSSLDVVAKATEGGATSRSPHVLIYYCQTGSDTEKEKEAHLRMTNHKSEGIRIKEKREEK